ncbi:benzoylformate decarboxylase [Sulfolobus acidocaldarius SUSAZ]|nr:benzoylformate decarboxylase [Sulfolobus acidocaldarius SUSAZ]
MYDLLSKYTNSIYGNPGTTELHFLKYLPNNMVYYLALHDGVAVGLSEGYYLKSRNLGVVNLHAGPGLSNAFGYIYSAYRNKSPLLIIAGQQPSYSSPEEPMLYYNFSSLPSVKEYVEIKNSKETIKFMNRAIRTCLTYPYGPVVVSLPYDIIEDISNEDVTYGKVVEGNICSESVIIDTVEKIKSSNQIAIVVGYEIEIFDASQEVMHLSNKLNCPVYAEPYLSRSSGIRVNETLPTRASELNKIIRNYDLVLVLGAELHRVLYMDEDIHWKNVIQVTSDVNEARKRPWNTTVCNLKYFTSKLNELITPRSSPSRVIQRQKRRNEKISNMLKLLLSYTDGYTVFGEASSQGEEIRELFSSTRFYSNRSGLLGWALPAGVGYASAGGKSLIIMGDGSFNYAPQAIWTASRYDLKVKILVINNSGYEALRSRAGYERDFFSPETHPWRMAEAYDFTAKEFEDYQLAVKWLMEGEERKLAEIRVEE